MGLLDSLKDKVEGQALQSMVESQAKNYLGGSSSSSSENKDTQNNDGDNKESSSSSSNQYVNKIESFIGDERISQIKNKVGEANFKKAESAIESQIESRFK